MKVTIVGVRKFESKGRTAFEYSCTKDFTVFDLQNSECEGQSVVSEFSYTDFGIHAGDVVEFDYEPGYQGQARLVGVRPIISTPASDPKNPKETK